MTKQIVKKMPSSRPTRATTAGLCNGLEKRGHSGGGSAINLVTRACGFSSRFVTNAGGCSSLGSFTLGMRSLFVALRRFNPYQAKNAGMDARKR